MIIGITGTLGAGKGTVVDYLKTKNFKHFSARDFLTEEIIKRGLPVNLQTMPEVANDLRAKHSPSFIVEELYKKAKEAGGDCVIESIRTPGEVEVLRGQPDFYLLAVDALLISRYERIQKRASELDRVTFEEFAEAEKKQMTSIDPNKQNLTECIRLADYVINNDGTIEDLNNQVEDILQAIINK